MLAGQQSQLVKAEREVRKYRTEMADLHEQQTYLYASYLREARTLQRELVTAEKRAAAAERQHQEDVVRIESWATMADALETTGGINGEEGQRKVAMMGRRLTSLRVREMELARQSTIQHAELKDLRASRASLKELGLADGGGPEGGRSIDETVALEFLTTTSSRRAASQLSIHASLADASTRCSRCCR